MDLVGQGVKKVQVAHMDQKVLEENQAYQPNLEILVVHWDLVDQVDQEALVGLVVQVVLEERFHLEDQVNQGGQKDLEVQMALVDQMDRVVLVVLKDHYHQVGQVDQGDLVVQMVQEVPMDLLHLVDQVNQEVQ